MMNEIKKTIIYADLTNFRFVALSRALFFPSRTARRRHSIIIKNDKNRRREHKFAQRFLSMSWLIQSHIKVKITSKSWLYRSELNNSKISSISGRLVQGTQNDTRFGYMRDDEIPPEVWRNLLTYSAVLALFPLLFNVQKFPELCFKNAVSRLAQRNSARSLPSEKEHKTKERKNKQFVQKVFETETNERKKIKRAKISHLYGNESRSC